MKAGRLASLVGVFFVLAPFIAGMFSGTALLMDVLYRLNAVKYGINAARIGGSGGSSGAHLVSMLATLDGAGDPDDADLVNR